jgi:hypothetical protein
MRTVILNQQFWPALGRSARGLPPTGRRKQVFLKRVRQLGNLPGIPSPQWASKPIPRLQHPALGQSCRFDPLPATSGFPPDICRPARLVRLVPQPDSCTAASMRRDSITPQAATCRICGTVRRAPCTLCSPSSKHVSRFATIPFDDHCARCHFWMLGAFHFDGNRFLGAWCPLR